MHITSKEAPFWVRLNKPPFFFQTYFFHANPRQEGSTKKISAEFFPLLEGFRVLPSRVSPRARRKHRPGVGQLDVGSETSRRRSEDVRHRRGDEVLELALVSYGMMFLPRDLGELLLLLLLLLLLVLLLLLLLLFEAIGLFEGWHTMEPCLTTLRLFRMLPGHLQKTMIMIHPVSKRKEQNQSNSCDHILLYPYYFKGCIRFVFFWGVVGGAMSWTCSVTSRCWILVEDFRN